MWSHGAVSLRLFVVVSLLLVPGAGCIHCLVEGTLVTTPSGPVPIENLSVGQEVICVSACGEQATGRVVAMKSANTGSYRAIWLEGHEKSLRVTAAHPVSTSKTWTSACNVRVGDLLHTRIGLRRVKAIDAHTDAVRVFDITVYPHHRFFADGVLVHNKSIADPPTPSEVAGVYVGQLEDGPGTDCRLDLRLDGTGLCALTHDGSNKVRLYSVMQWVLEDREITIKLRELDQPAEGIPFRLHGKACGAILQLEAEMLKYDDKWVRFRLRMRNESEFEERLGRLKHRMGGHANSP